MFRALSVLGSLGLLTGVGVVCGGVGKDDPARPAAPAVSDAEVLGAAEAATAAAATGDADAPADPSREALVRTIALLKDGLERLGEVPTYTAVFEKREVVDGCLLDPQAMEMTLRHEPYAVHMAWIEGHPGRELLYEEGANDGCMLINPGGWKQRLTGTLKLDIHGALATREARHPCTSLGMGRLAKKLLRYRLAELAGGNVDCTLADGAEFDGRPCWRNVLVYKTPEDANEFRKSILLIDREWNLPVSVRTFGWPTDACPEADLDEQTVIESYAYTDVNLAPPTQVADLAALGSRFRVR